MNRIANPVGVPNGAKDVQYFFFKPALLDLIDQEVLVASHHAVVLNIAAIESAS
jgi:hypothetical protein